MLITNALDMDALRSRLTGEIRLPDDPDWDRARQAWNLFADQHPLAVAFPETDEDVVALVDAARQAGVRLAPQATGHGAVPMTGLEEAILVSTSRMRDVRIDSEAQTARVRAGALWIDVTEPASQHGLAPLAGSSPDVGVVGYTLGGGVSWLARKHGLASNSVTAVEMVLPDGRLVRTDAETEPDLFWAVRGGGGSFGIVTALEIRLFPAGELYGGSLLWPWERAAEILQAWREWTREVPDEVTSSARIIQVPPLPDVPEPLRGRKLVNVDVVVLADAERGAELLAPLTALEPEMAMLGALAPAALSRLHNDPEQPVPGMVRGLMLETLPEAAVDALVALAGPGSGSPLVGAELRHLGGALSRQPAGCGALASLPGEYLLGAVGVVVDEAAALAIEAHVARLLAAMEPYRASHNLLNFEERTTNPATLFDPQCYARLRQVKAVVDPGELILANHTIPPARRG